MNPLMGMASSKKFLVTAATVLLAGFGVDLPEEMVATVIAYVVGQGIADHGKERAKLEQAT